ncbi:YdcF family protein [Gilliamella sp. B3023]|uniref:YdcF family protein n=1 Tax=unclassified Gilliamella TaxID=2685620 RepID=UPI00226A1519|nr:MULTISPECIES: YdcF family protein [unclassified Gilliamella]MCX8585544.1 YdcF family protein [Gilliamella sp. B3562]MCX8674265.1 YdcF family protein [Gilliamella sp. B3023]MCX8685455.1 YdcF family protein [Gilliamella sp. B2864]
MTIMKLIKYCLILILVYFIICNIIIFIYANRKPLTNADTLVVLGSQVVGTPAEAPPTLQNRLDTAFNYLQSNPNTKVIVCGGQGSDESATEASVMADYLIKKGIDSSRVYLEDRSRRTAQQFVYANQILPLGKTVVVTNDFHILRSIMLAKRSGISDITGLPAPLAYTNIDKYIAMIREPLALLNSWLFDHPLDYVENNN